VGNFEWENASGERRTISFVKPTIRRQGEGKNMSNEGVTAVERALSLLDSFGPARTTLSLAEFTAAVPLHKTTIFRLLNSLERMGYVVKAADGRYSLGPRALYIGSVYAMSFSLEKIVRPELHALSESTSESASFYVEAPGGRLCLLRVEPVTGLREHILAGSIFAPDRSATGLAFEKSEEWNSGTCDDALPYATSGKRDPYTSSFATPVFGAGDRFAGALALSGPTVRIQAADREWLSARLMASADRIARALGASTQKRRAFGVDPSPPP
jgi:DNA-binding IclR family transcriptional regulator